jgi:hypothetical protein
MHAGGTGPPLSASYQSKGGIVLGHTIAAELRHTFMFTIAACDKQSNVCSPGVGGVDD